MTRDCFSLDCDLEPSLGSLSSQPSFTPTTHDPCPLIVKNLLPFQANHGLRSSTASSLLVVSPPGVSSISSTVKINDLLFACSFCSSSYFKTRQLLFDHMEFVHCYLAENIVLFQNKTLFATWKMEFEEHIEDFF